MHLKYTHEIFTQRRHYQQHKYILRISIHTHSVDYILRLAIIVKMPMTWHETQD